MTRRDVILRRGCFFGRYQGILCSVVAAVWIVIWGSLLKNLKDFNALELSFYIYLFSSSFNLPMALWNQRSQPTVTRRILFLWLLFALFQLSNAVLRTSAFQILPLGDTSSIVFSTPIFTAIFARFILKDKLTWMTIFSLVMSVLGMLLTMRLPEVISTAGTENSIGSMNHLIGCCYAFGAVISCAAMFIVMRSLKAIPPLLNNLAQAILSCVISSCLVPTLFGGFHHPNCDWVISISIVTVGLMSFLATFFLNRALQLEDPTTVGTVYRSTDIILAFLIQVLAFKDGVDAYNISGAFLVFACGLLMPLQRWMESQPEGSAWRESWLIK